MTELHPVRCRASALFALCCLALAACSGDSKPAAIAAPADTLAPLDTASSGSDTATAKDVAAPPLDVASGQDASSLVDVASSNDAAVAPVDAGQVQDTAVIEDAGATVDTTGAKDAGSVADTAAAPLDAGAAQDVAAGPADTKAAVDAGPAPVAKEDWVALFGGNGSEQVKAVVADSKGNVYVAGIYTEALTIGTKKIQAAEPGKKTPDSFVASFDSAGAFRWAHGFGAAKADTAYEIAIDGLDNVYVAGSHHSDLLIGGVQLKNGGSTDIYVVAYDSSGQQLWAKGWGGQYGQSPRDLSVNAAGDIFITGGFNGAITADGITAKSSSAFGGLSEIFVLAIDGKTHKAMWVQIFTGAGHDVGTALVGDNIRNTVIAVSFQNDLVINKAKGTVFNSGGLNFDAGLVRLDDKGNVLWAKMYGGSGSEEIVGLDMDAAGNIYATGVFSGTASFGGPNLVGVGGFDTVLAGYNGKGGHLWSVAYTGAATNQPLDLEVAGDGIYIAGRFKGALKLGGTTLNSHPGKFDILVARFATANGKPVWARSVGSASDDQGSGVGVGNDGVFVGGHVKGAVKFAGATKALAGVGLDGAVFRFQQ